MILHLVLSLSPKKNTWLRIIVLYNIFFKCVTQHYNGTPPKCVFYTTECARRHHWDYRHLYIDMKYLVPKKTDTECDSHHNPNPGRWWIDCHGAGELLRKTSSNSTSIIIHFCEVKLMCKHVKFNVYESCSEMIETTPVFPSLRDRFWWKLA